MTRTQIPAQSEVTPGMGAFNGRLYVAWRTLYELMIVGAPDPLRQAEGAAADTGEQWGTGSPLGEFSYHGPALCQFGERLYIAWTGTDNAALLNVMSSADGLNFDKTTKVTLPENSAYGPALTTDGYALYLAWVGTDPQHQLNVISSQDGVTFNHEDKHILGESSGASPALAVNTSDGTFLMTWTDPDKHIRVGQLARVEPVGSAVNGWVRIGDPLPGQETLHGPSLVMYQFQQSGGATPRLAYSGTDDNHLIYIMFSDQDPLIFPRRRDLEDSSPPDGPAMIALNPFDASTFYMGYVRGDNHHLNVISFDVFG
jgi:hypothetical protein